MSLANIEPPVPVVTVHASQLRERVLIVGDVHGCLDELKALLNKANFADGRTSVVLVGDVCNKGPHSAATVAYCRENNFLCVRGNHDHAALKVRLPHPLSAKIASDRTRQAFHRLGPKYSNELPDSWKWVTSLSGLDVEWLTQLPYVLDCPFGLVVHAGLHPGVVSLRDQQPRVCMSMRNIRASDGCWFECDSGGAEAWAPMWSGTRVFFGHDARRRLQKCQWALGLDTACVYGHELTAAEVSAASGAFVAFDDAAAEVKLISVSATAIYHAQAS
jgi:bis(5'-nucleosyl)-tetraphosphatase (symmetrical)